MPIDPAPSVMTTSPGLAIRAIAVTTSSSVGATCDRHVDLLANRRRQRVERDARNRILARRVDVGQHDLIGAGQRGPERVHQRRGPRVAVRLEHDDDAAVERARRVEHRGDFRRVVAVVVHDEDAVRLRP